MRVFVAGGSGALGRRLVPQLVARGHQVTATATSAARLGLLAQLGADAVVMDGLDAVSVGEAVAAARPDAIVHQMTALSAAHAGKPDLKHPDRFFATTIRLRSEGTDHLLAAAEATGVSHVVAQSFGAFNGIREGGWVKAEENPVDPGPASAREGAQALRHLEDVVVEAGGAVLRYGSLYGPGTIDDWAGLARKRQFPLVGGGTGYMSWVHLDDAASAAVLALEQEAAGVFNIVDDEPAPASEWLPYLAACAGAKRPVRVPRWVARLLAGDMAVIMMTEGAAAPTPRRSGSSAGSRATPHGGRGSRKSSREQGRGLRAAAAAAVRDRLPDPRQRERGRGRGPGDLAALPGLPGRAPVGQGVPLGRGHRISIDILRSARARREEYAGQWFPEPLLTDPYQDADQDPERSAELADSVSMAALVLLERLSPLERAVFVLREVFGFGLPEVASAVGRSEAACRQLAMRARRHMDAGRPRFEADRREREKLAARFFGALCEGDVEGLRELLAADVQVVADGGGKAPQLARAVMGADNVARVLASIFPWLVRIDVTVQPRQVNGQPGAIFRDRDGKVLNTLALDILDGQIQAIRSVINPRQARAPGSGGRRLGGHPRSEPGSPARCPCGVRNFQVCLVSAVQVVDHVPPRPARFRCIPSCPRRNSHLRPRGGPVRRPPPPPAPQGPAEAGRTLQPTIEIRFEPLILTSLPGLSQPEPSLTASRPPSR